MDRYEIWAMQGGIVHVANDVGNGTRSVHRPFNSGMVLEIEVGTKSFKFTEHSIVDSGSDCIIIAWPGVWM